MRGLTASACQEAVTGISRPCQATTAHAATSSRFRGD